MRKGMGLNQLKKDLRLWGRTGRRRSSQSKLYRLGGPQKRTAEMRVASGQRAYSAPTLSEEEAHGVTTTLVRKRARRGTSDLKKGEQRRGEGGNTREQPIAMGTLDKNARRHCRRGGLRPNLVGPSSHFCEQADRRRGRERGAVKSLEEQVR
jgi:hypothetical protein